jgi:hypothetical protein
VTEPAPMTELAERIKALKAAHTLEPAPQRSQARTSATAEEPVTARIRGRRGERLAPQPADATEPPAAPTGSHLPSTGTAAAETRPAHNASPAPTPAPTEEEPVLFRLAADGPAASRSRPPCRDGIAHARSRKPLQMSLVLPGPCHQTEDARPTLPDQSAGLDIFHGRPHQRPSTQADLRRPRRTAPRRRPGPLLADGPRPVPASRGNQGFSAKPFTSRW